MPTVNPTFSDVSWGPDPWSYFDYFQNPTRITGGNPLLMLFHAGGWNTKSHRSYRDSTDTELWHFVRWLLGSQDPNVVGQLLASSPTTKWDVASVAFGQQKHDASVIPRSRSLYGMDVVRDCQRAIASVKGLYNTYGFNPNKVIVGGESSGAMTSALSQLVPARFGNGQSKVWRDSNYGPNTFDSTARGILFSEGPVDIRNSNNDNPPTGTDYFHFSRIGAFLGVNQTTATEWNAVPAAVKSALSVRAYFESEDLASYPGMYVVFTSAGNGVKPLGNGAGSDPHDSVQLSDLRTTMGTAGVTFYGQLVSDWTIAEYPTTISTATLAIFQPIEKWMREQTITSF